MRTIKIDIKESKLARGDEVVVYSTGARSVIVAPKEIAEVEGFQDIAFTLLSTTAAYNDDVVPVHIGYG